MVEKIIITPERVRGYGNVVTPHVVGDYQTYNSSISEGTATINEQEWTVYTSTYSPPTYDIVLTVSSDNVSLGDTITLTATVTLDETPAEGVTVIFKDTTESVGSATTNSSGVATYNYTLNVAGVRELTASVGSSYSEEVEVTVNKLATSTSLSLSSTTISTDESTTATATVTSGGSGISGGTVTFKDGNNTLGTGTTNSSGVATYTISGLSAGSHSITAVVTETSTYSTSTSTAVTVTVSSAPTVSSVSLTGTSNILSYSDNETCTLSATVLDTNSQPVNGETVTFYNGSTSMGTATTNASGVATKTYSGTGAGDVSFTAECSNITSSAYTVEDCILYDISSSSNLSKYTVPSGLTFTFDTDHYVCKTTSQSWKNLNRTFTSSATTFTLSFDVLFTNNQSNTQLDTYVLGTNNKGMSVLTAPVDSVYRLSSATGVGTQTNPVSKTYSYTRNAWYHIETIVEQGTTTTNMYQNNSLVETITNTNISFSNLNKLAFYVGWNSQAIIHLKNIKIKAI